MNERIVIAATSAVAEADLASAKLGQRFGRLDLQSRLAVLAVARLNLDFNQFAPGRVAICLVARAGSLTTDFNFWSGRHAAGGPSPTLFAYTLPSAAVGEIAIHFRLTGPNLCLVGDENLLLAEGRNLIERGEADACIGVFCDVVSPEVAAIIATVPAAKAIASFLKRERV